VARTPDPVLKQELLDQVVRYLADHSIGLLSLNPMAESLGMSRHRLNHHFGQRDELIAAALRRAIDMQEEVQTKWFVEQPAMRQDELFRRWWKWLTSSSENLALVRLGLEAATLEAAVTGLSVSTRADQIGVWRSEIENRLVAAGVPRKRAAVEATTAKAVFTGMVVDLMASGETKRLTAALDEYLIQFAERVAILSMST
jgi:AcrR family transcriptional regulator